VVSVGPILAAFSRKQNGGWKGKQPAVIIECGVFLLGTEKLLRRRRRWIAKHHSAAAAECPHKRVNVSVARDTTVPEER
jgi:hypothetical protein